MSRGVHTKRKCCSRCRQTKRAVEFNRAAGRKDGLDSQCKACRAAYRGSVEGRSVALLKDARRRAKAKGIKFSLTREWVIDRLRVLTCEATGWLFVIQSGRGHHPFAPSIDRINPLKGYTPANCRIVISAVNTLKGILRADIAAALSPIRTSWDVERQQMDEFALFLAIYGEEVPLPLAA